MIGSGAGGLKFSVLTVLFPLLSPWKIKIDVTSKTSMKIARATFTYLDARFSRHWRRFDGKYVCIEAFIKQI